MPPSPPSPQKTSSTKHTPPDHNLHRHQSHHWRRHPCDATITTPTRRACRDGAVLTNRGRLYQRGRALRGRSDVADDRPKAAFPLLLADGLELDGQLCHRPGHWRADGTRIRGQMCGRASQPHACTPSMALLLSNLSFLRHTVVTITATMTMLQCCLPECDAPIGTESTNIMAVEQPMASLHLE